MSESSFDSSHESASSWSESSDDSTSSQSQENPNMTPPVHVSKDPGVHGWAEQCYIEIEANLKEQLSTTVAEYIDIACGKAEARNNDETLYTGDLPNEHDITIFEMPFRTRLRKGNKVVVQQDLFEPFWNKITGTLDLPIHPILPDDFDKTTYNPKSEALKIENLFYRYDSDWESSKCQLWKFTGEKVVQVNLTEYRRIMLRNHNRAKILRGTNTSKTAVEIRQLIIGDLNQKTYKPRGPQDEWRIVEKHKATYLPPTREEKKRIASMQKWTFQSSSNTVKEMEPVDPLDTSKPNEMRLTRSLMANLRIKDEDRKVAPKQYSRNYRPESVVASRIVIMRALEEDILTGRKIRIKYHGTPSGQTKHINNRTTKEDQFIVAGTTAGTHRSREETIKQDGSGRKGRGESRKRKKEGKVLEDVPLAKKIKIKLNLHRSGKDERLVESTPSCVSLRPPVKSGKMLRLGNALPTPALTPISSPSLESHK